MKKVVLGAIGALMLLGVCYAGLWVYERCKAAELVYQYLQSRAAGIDKVLGGVK